MAEDESDTLYLKTVVIGAGFSGVSSAIHLLNNDYNDFIICEALDRIGGRCYTFNYGENFIEMGAQFIHGQIDNPIYYIARDNKQIDEEYNKIHFDSAQDSKEDYSGICIELEKFDESDEESHSYLFANQFGETIKQDLAVKIYKITNKVARNAEEYYLRNPEAREDISVADYMYTIYWEIINSEFESDLANDANNSFKRLVDGFFIWRCKCENIENGCDTMRNLSLNNYCVYKELAGSQIMELNYGYVNILDLIVEQHKEKFYERLKLKHVLEKILICHKLLDLDDNCSPSLQSGSCDHCLYTKDKNKIVLIINDNRVEDKLKRLVVICDNVLCTMSLGYLKANLTNLIQPAYCLPKQKLDSVMRLGYGTVNKIFLVYEKAFWSEKLNGIHVVWMPNENEQVLEQLNNFEEENWFRHISYIETVKGQSNVLCAWIAGCVFVESFQDEKVSNDCTHLLRKLLGNEDIPLPINILRSKWNSNKYFKGSYSNLPLGSLKTDFDSIAEPIQFENRPFIMFAGEATIKEYYSTIHGAYLSGIREAKRILSNSN